VSRRTGSNLLTGVGGRSERSVRRAASPDIHVTLIEDSSQQGCEVLRFKKAVSGQICSRIIVPVSSFNENANAGKENVVESPDSELDTC
jgi:hypothetical protein